MYQAKVIEDSTCYGVRLTTFQLRYWRAIHGEFMTHRVFSRNASSSRAIPVEKMIDMVRTEPAMPLHWGKNQRGMQAKDQLEGENLMEAIRIWEESADLMAIQAEKFVKIGLHKQVANRILEPFQWIDVICTSSSYDNFFHLRAHEDAQPEINHLANLMIEALDDSTPKELSEGEYHLPYIREHEKAQYDISDLVKFSAARCARVSYLTHDGGNPSPEKDLELFERLVGSDPIHASPTEHIATPSNFPDEKPGMSGNFHRTWNQYRKFLETNQEDIFLNK